MKSLKVLALNSVLSLLCHPVMAADVEPAFTYQGRFVDSSGQPLAGELDLRFQIFSANGKCLLYEEKQKVTLSKSHNGVASVKVGSMPSHVKRTSSDPGLKMKDVFSNDSLIPPHTSCADGYTPRGGDARWLRVFVNSGSQENVLIPDQVIGSVPTAIVAETLQGLTIGDLDQRYILNSRITNLVSGKLCYAADGTNIKCDRDLSSVKGEKGDRGVQGEKGEQGVAGAKGEKGDRGVQGEKGAQGVAGAKGEKGDRGLPGEKGAQGPQGVAGAKGATGAKGDRGEKGSQGDRGLAGAMGPQGPQGKPGATGPQGPQGPKGSDGRGLTSLGKNCPTGEYLKGLNSDGSLNCASLDPFTFKPQNVRVYSKEVDSNVSSAKVFCPAGAARLSCSGTRSVKMADTCDEDECGIIGVKPIVEDGKQGCMAAIDTGPGTQIGVYAVCYTDKPQVVTPVTDVPTWIQRKDASETHDQACARAGMKVSSDQGYGVCASGERRPNQGRDHNEIKYSYGTWGSTLVGGKVVGNYCYADGQKRDNDKTDITVAYLCK